MILPVNNQSEIESQFSIAQDPLVFHENSRLYEKKLLESVPLNAKRGGESRFPLSAKNERVSLSFPCVQWKKAKRGVQVPFCFLSAIEKKPLVLSSH